MRDPPSFREEGHPPSPATSLLSWQGIRLVLGPDRRITLPDGVLLTGDIIALLGPSGCGKSTLLRVLLGDLSIAGAEVYLGANAIRSVPVTLRPNYFAVLRQSNGLLPEESALTNCLVGRYREVNPVGRARDRLTQLGIPEDLWHEQVARLSGGQQRRVALARTLVLERPVLVLDEPTSGLDALSTGEVADILSHTDLWRRRCGILVTHDEHFARRVGTLLGRVLDGAVHIERIRPPRGEHDDAVSPTPPWSLVHSERPHVFYGPSWVFQLELTRMGTVVAPLLIVSSYIIGATLLSQSLGFANLSFTRLVDMPRTILVTVLRGLVLDVVPLVVGLLYAGIGGAAIAGRMAALGTTGVLETLRWLGRKDTWLFGAPTAAASLVSLPLIAVLSAGAAVLGVGTVLTTGRLSLGAAALVPALEAALAGRTALAFLTIVKSAAFALVVSVIAVLVGRHVQGDSEAIARAAALSVLLSSLGVVITNGLLTCFG